MSDAFDNDVRLALYRFYVEHGRPPVAAELTTTSFTARSRPPTGGTRLLFRSAWLCQSPVKSDNLTKMKDITATEAARRFSEVLDAVEHRGESFVISRKGRPIARLNPSRGTTGKTLLKILNANRRDQAWASELQELRSLLTLEDTRWNG